MSKVIQVQDATFEQEVLQSSTPVLVDYWAEWCGPCRAVAPVVEATAEQYDGRLKVAKLNVDDSGGIPARYGIRSIPTLMLFINGEVAATQLAASPRRSSTRFSRPICNRRQPDSSPTIKEVTMSSSSPQPAESAATQADLFTPIQLGDLELPSRIIMAPLTRNRAGPGNAPIEVNTRYYAQRASAGLVISEATQASWRSIGYPNTPGIHTPEQIAGWRRVTDAVHAAGGHMFLQLWHVGRISHPSMQPDGALPLAPSAIAPAGAAMTYKGMQPYVTPRALETSEIPGIVEEFRQGARNAIEAGFDGVEVHGANGYLLDQFLRDGTNRRTDRYGGPIENRARFMLEVLEGVLDVWPASRVGIRLSPSAVFNDMHDSDPQATFGYVINALNRYDLAYLHIIEPAEADEKAGVPLVPSSHFRPIYQGRLMVNGDYDGNKGNEAIASGDADLVSFGKRFIANPDLPRRLAEDAPLNAPDQASFYGGDERGYVDYPSLDEVA